MQIIRLKQGFPHSFSNQFKCLYRTAMQNPRSLSDLLSRTGNKVTVLKNRSRERARILEQVRAALPARLAEAVVSAGLDQGKLTVGVVGAAWASRLKYLTESIAKRVAAATGSEVLRVKVRVVPPPAVPPAAAPRAASRKE
jgi:hypothetical protein